MSEIVISEPKIEAPSDQCARCAGPHGRDGNGLRKCSRCKCVAYCSVECQHKHWKSGHKMLCAATDSSEPRAVEATRSRTSVHREHGTSALSETTVSALHLGQKAKKLFPSAEEEECANCAAVGNRINIVLSKCSKCLMVAYCSRACQIQHWKDGGHKRFCVSPSDRAPSTHGPDSMQAPSSGGLHGDDDHCVICDSDMDPSSTLTLPCGHRFHAVCVASVRQFGVSQKCPMCRAPLPPECETAASEHQVMSCTE